jgi:uncharacterized membrane protein
MQEHSLLEKVVRKFVPFIPFSESLFLGVSLTIFVVVKESLVYIYINKDGNPSTKSTRHVKANVNT